MEMVQKSGMYDDRLPGIRWRFPHQCAHWFGMTCSDGPPNSNLSFCCVNPKSTISYILKKHRRGAACAFVWKFIRKLRFNQQVLAARDFGAAERIKSEGILCVFRALDSARLGQKIRCQPQMIEAEFPQIRTGRRSCRSRPRRCARRRGPWAGRAWS